MKPGDLVWDADLRRFGARCRGSSTSYILKYRVNGHQRWFTIGKDGPLTSTEARAKARQLLAEVDSGRGPARARDGRLAMPLVPQHAERWIREHVALKRKPATIAQYRRI